MKYNKLNYFISGLFLLTYTITFLIDFFTVKAISLVSFVMCVGALFAFFIFLRKLDSLYYVGILVFTFFAQFLGAMLNMYTVIPIYDLLLHFSSGTLLVFLGHYAYELLLKHDTNKNIPLVITIFFCTLFSIASAAVWEIWEFSGDVLFGLNSQIDLNDTMTDIIAGSVGAIIGSILLWLILKKRKATSLIKDTKI